MNEKIEAFVKSPWLLGILAAVAVFALCFVGLSSLEPEEEAEPEVELKVVATMDTNAPLIEIARQQGWIAPTATELTTVDAAQVHDLGNAFENSKLVTFHEFSNFVGVQTIPANAFAHNDKLTEITIPANVADIEYGAFAYCPSMQVMRVDTANTHYDSRNDCNAIISTWKGSLMLVAGCRTTNIPDGVRYIAAQAFRGCEHLQKVSFPSKMESIGDEAFMDCKSLTEIAIPQGVDKVEPGTFAGCTSLQKVVLTKSVKKLQKGAFRGCTALKTIECPKKYPPIATDAFDAFTATVFVPKGKLNDYYRDKVWKNFKNIKELP